jgi:ferrochelatase
LNPTARHGLLLTNLGTPDSPEVPAVRRYLGEFLWDRHVIDMNPVGRWLLLHGIILRVRPRKSAHAYAKVWTPEGSPLLVHSRRLTERVRDALGDDWKVSLGMRYGRPSLEDGLRELLTEPLASLTILPLYPQYATSTTYSTLERVEQLLPKLTPTPPPLRVVRDFFTDPGFCHAQAEVARPLLGDFRPDRVLFSFHGLPERHLTRIHPEACRFDACCDAVEARNALCYRAQAFATARHVAQALGLADADKPLVSFQSRLGRIPWIRPYTEDLLAELPKQGVKRLAVLCPSFTADCLETIEEIGIRAKETFVEHGGEDLLAVPCVNAHPRWVEAVGVLARGAAPLGDKTPTALCR